jgi:chromosome segregation ATPase
MKKKGGLVDRILKTARDDTMGPAGKVVRKKITLDTLQKVIGEYVQQTAGMGDPELRSRVVQLELQLGTIREQNGSLQKAMESARAGWRSAQEDLAKLAEERAGVQEHAGEDLHKARAEAREALEALARMKGKQAAAELLTHEAEEKVAEAKTRVDEVTRRLDEARRNEKSMRGEVKTLSARMKGLKESHRLEVEALRDRMEILAAGFDHMELLPRLDWEGLIERAKAASANAGDLSVEAEGAARSTLEEVAKRCDEIRLELEGGREEQEAKVRDMGEGRADFAMVARITEIQQRVSALEAELAFLEVISDSFRPPEEAEV